VTGGTAFGRQVVIFRITTGHELGLMLRPVCVPLLAETGDTAIRSASRDLLDHDRDMSWVSRWDQFVFRCWLRPVALRFGWQIVILQITTGT
jgi:hypothetical protein